MADTESPQQTSTTQANAGNPPQSNLAALGKVPVQVVELDRGESGLGFNIKGGKDAPFVEGDPGIFVCKIRERGAAVRDGRLKEGDLILEINGMPIINVTHNEAVKHFINAHENVKLKIVPGAEQLIFDKLGKGRVQRTKSKTNVGNSRRGKVAVAATAGVGAVAAGAAFMMLNKDDDGNSPWSNMMKK
jgi:hypothetical protein